MNCPTPPAQPRLQLVPCTLKRALGLVALWHRHLPRCQGGLWAVGVAAHAGEAAPLSVVGVAVVGRPVARCLDNKQTVEVVRVATDGTPNACSALYGAATRAARALDYTRLMTCTRIGSALRRTRSQLWTCLEWETGLNLEASEVRNKNSRRAEISVDPNTKRGVGCSVKT